MKRTIGSAALAGLLALAAGAMAQGQKPGQDRGMAAPARKTPPATEAANAGFERMKGLVGDWEGSAYTEGKDEKFPAAVTYRTTGGGSTVVETLFPGTEHEMVTMYYRDGNDLVLTHYCAVGNQPHMKARKGVASDKLTFDFAGGANIEPGRTLHMHSATVAFVDNDRLRNQWVLYDGGKPTETKIFDLARRK